MLERGTIGAFIAVGITLSGLFVAVGVSQVRSGDRFVTVKGVAEREVRADVAIWPLHVAPGIMSEGQVAKLVRVVSTVEYFLRD